MNELLIIGSIIYVCVIIWLIWEARNAPQMDDDGNIIEK
jgi:nitrogen fixation-related uncharacterized protein